MLRSQNIRLFGHGIQLLQNQTRQSQSQCLRRLRLKKYGLIMRPPTNAICNPVPTIYHRLFHFSYVLRDDGEEKRNAEESTVDEAHKNVKIEANKNADNVKEMKVELDADNTIQVKPKKQKRKKKKNTVVEVDDKLREAAVDAAKAVPGDWHKTADELLARLLMPIEKTEQDQTKEASGTASRLKTMGVGKAQKLAGSQNQASIRRERTRVLEDDMTMRTMRTSQSSRGQDRFKNQKDDLEKLGKSGWRLQRDIGMRQPREKFKPNDIFQEDRLMVFDAEKVKASVSKKPTVLGTGLWEKVDREKFKILSSPIPRNAFEEMIDWTLKGKLWSFPINNEADMHEERHYKFHDHVFLEKHLTNFPNKGPIRKFMELVCMGLSQSPYLSVPEKIEHINALGEIFRGKLELLEMSLPPEQARMLD